MSKQLEKDAAVIGRYCTSNRNYMTSSLKDGAWKVQLPNAALVGCGETYVGAVHELATAVHAKVVGSIEYTAKKMARELAENQAIIGDWTKGNG